MTVRRGAILALLALVCAAPPPAGAQTLTATVVGDAVRVHVTGWPFLTAEPLAAVKEGRTVRVELALLVLTAPGRNPAASARQAFSVSYDLWEERFAVTAAGPHGAAVSHLTAAAAQAWCVEQLAVPIAAIAALEDRRFWVKLESRILDADAPAESDEGGGLTLQRLIDVLSRKRRPDTAARVVVEGGPFRLPR